MILEKSTYISPPGWISLQVRDVIEKISLSNRKVKKKYYLYDGLIPVIDQGQEFTGGYTNDEQMRIHSDAPLIIFGDHTRILKYVPFDFAAGADGVKVMKPTLMFVPKLFYYFLHVVKLPKKGYARHFQYLEKSFIQCPPINEQHRIVSKIEELFSKLDAGVEALKQAQEQLKRYRQSVLKAAVEGKLTADWREKHKHELEPADKLLERIVKERREKWEAEQLAKYEAKGKEPPPNWQSKYQKPIPLNTTDLPKLPEGWIWTTFNQAGEINRGKSKHRPRNDPTLFDGEYPFIQTGDIREANKFIKKYKQTYNELGLKQSRLWPKGTLCITIAANIADTAILSFDACFPDSVVGFFSNPSCNIYYIEYYLRLIKGNLEKYAPATAQKNINLRILNDLTIPLPPSQEQRRIINEIDRLFSMAEKVEKIIEYELVRSNNLRQAILKQAFEGKLVPQDPNDEPASVLLEKIKAEKAKAKQSKQLEKH